MTEPTVFTPILELIVVIGLGFLLGLMHYLKEHNIGDRDVINQVEWFAIVLLPVVSIPEFIKYVSWPVYSFFVFFIAGMGIWVAITIHNRPRDRGITGDYRIMMLVFIFLFLFVGMLAFWELQAIDVIKRQAESLNATKISG